MNERVLRRFIVALLKEEGDNPRIPTQLISPESVEAQKSGKVKDKETNDDGDVLVDENETCLDEFSAVGGGAMSGFSAPLGRKTKK